MGRNRGGRSPTSQAERPGADPSLTALKGTNPTDIWISTSSLQTCNKKLQVKDSVSSGVFQGTKKQIK